MGDFAREFSQGLQQGFSIGSKLRASMEKRALQQEHADVAATINAELQKLGAPAAAAMTANAEMEARLAAGETVLEADQEKIRTSVVATALARDKAAMDLIANAQLKYGHNEGLTKGLGVAFKSYASSSEQIHAELEREEKRIYREREFQFRQDEAEADRKHQDRVFELQEKGMDLREAEQKAREERQNYLDDRAEQWRREDKALDAKRYGDQQSRLAAGDARAEESHDAAMKDAENRQTAFDQQQEHVKTKQGFEVMGMIKEAYEDGATVDQIAEWTGRDPEEIQGVLGGDMAGFSEETKANVIEAKRRVTAIEGMLEEDPDNEELQARLQQAKSQKKQYELIELEVWAADADKADVAAKGGLRRGLEAIKKGLTEFGYGAVGWLTLVGDAPASPYDPKAQAREKAQESVEK